MKKLFLLLLIPFSALAVSDGPTMSWNNPTAYTDGLPLPAGAITGYTYECKLITDSWPGSITGTITGEATSYQFDPFTFQAFERYECRMNVVDNNGIASGWAFSAPFDVDPRIPGPVINFSVQ